MLFTVMECFDTGMLVEGRLLMDSDWLKRPVDQSRPDCLNLF